MLKFDTATLPAQIISAAVISSLNVLIPNCGELEDNVVWELVTTNLIDYMTKLIWSSFYVFVFQL
jgi:hypothetical protein